jgi:hypothetical protein
MNSNSLEVGDMIAVNRIGYKHVGIYVGQHSYGNRCVIHNAKGNGVILSTFQEFAGGDSVFIHQKAAGNYFERHAIAKRALSLLGQEYDLLKFNCEHAAHFSQNGVAESPQMAGAVVLALIAVGLTVFFASDA